jgi:hypothetical protein
MKGPLKAQGILPVLHLFWDAVTICDRIELALSSLPDIPPLIEYLFFVTKKLRIGG